MSLFSNPLLRFRFVFGKMRTASGKYLVKYALRKCKDL
ncbi:hypothetical protein SBDP1_490041 [Syntrophobacter sp. SbD1]|nr:hypothetical protein SBDP1_490041 [Syntrophobacter sp. SbD1]